MDYFHRVQYEFNLYGKGGVKKRVGMSPKSHVKKSIRRFTRRMLRKQLWQLTN